MVLAPQRERRGYTAAADVELVLLAAQGDGDAFAELVRRSAPSCRRLLLRMGAQVAVAEDVAQDALLHALRKLPTFRGEAPFASWVMRIAARLYIKRARKEARHVFSPDPLDPELPDEGHAHAVDNRLDLDRALALLSPVEKLCVGLCHGAGLTHAEIAESTELPLGTVKSHVARGVKKLRRHMVGEMAGQSEQET